MQWVDPKNATPTIPPQGVTASVIVAYVGYDHKRDGIGLTRVRAGDIRVCPASYIGTDSDGPFFKSMENGRRLEVVAWMPLPEPPAHNGTTH